MNYYIKKKILYRNLFNLLLICSVWLTVSCFLFFRFDAPINFTHTSVIISFLGLIFIYREKISLAKPHIFLLLFFCALLLLSIVKLGFIKNETLKHYYVIWNNNIKGKDFKEFNSIFLFLKETFHLVFLILTIFIASIVIKKSQIDIESFKVRLQKCHRHK